MRRLLVVLTCVGVLGACAADSDVATTPTFTRARLVGTASTPTAANHRLAPPPVTVSGARAVYAATRGASVEPTNLTMRGAAWVIEDVDPTRVYRVPTRLRRATTILLPPGEQINKVIGGDVADYLVEASYAADRPAISVLPAAYGAQTNLVISTTGGLYAFELRGYAHTWTSVVDVRRPEPPLADRPGDHATSAAGDGLPRPAGPVDRLYVTPVSDDAPVPAWAPAEAWADPVKLVVRFAGPLPVLPGLFAGQAGEQQVNYRVERTSAAVALVTDRRVTEAELRLDHEVVRISAAPPPPPWDIRPKEEPRPRAERRPLYAAAGPLPSPSPPAVAVVVTPAMPSSAPPGDPALAIGTRRPAAIVLTPPPPSSAPVPRPFTAL